MNQRRYRVKTVLTETGERLPMLVNSEGIPIWWATVFSITEQRARNRAANTIGNTLRAILVFHLFLDLRGIDISSRMSDGVLLNIGEIEELVRLARMPVEDISLMLDKPDLITIKRSVPSLERVRQRSAPSPINEVGDALTATRLSAIRDYLKWIVITRTSSLSGESPNRIALQEAIHQFSNAIAARLPSNLHRGVINVREGLEPEVVSEMLRVVDAHSTENPWVDEHSRSRNELIIHWLLYLGLRRGELLGIRIPDIDFRKGTVIVARRADDLRDPRKLQPNAKTRAREIPISNALQDKTYAYVMNHRGYLAGARKHDFLFVATDSGAPLSIPSFAKIFNVLREKCPQLPRNLFAHLLRHTWNDRFSEEMDRRKTSEETERKTRSYLMGWSESSGTAATYTKRHIRKKAQEASLAMQEKIISGGEN